MSTRSKLIIYISPKEQAISFAQLRNRKTPKLRHEPAKRVINLANYDASIDYSKFAQDLCHDNGDKYYGHEFA